MQQPPPLILLVLIARAELVLMTGPCPSSLSNRTVLRGQSCFELHDTRVNWVTAQTSCRQRLGRLALIPDAETQSWLGFAAASLWPNQNSVWIGLNGRTVHGSFAWDGYNATAQPGSFFNWRTGATNGSTLPDECVCMSKSWAWKWTVASCSNRYYTYICEYPAKITTPMANASSEQALPGNRSSSASTNSPSTLVTGDLRPAQDVHPSVAAVCPAGLSSTTFVRNQSCYEFNGVQKNWVQARAYCHERDGRLVSITDANLQAWLSNTSARLWPTQNGVWVGLNDRSKSGVFLWDDYGLNAEHQMSYSNWASSYPRNGALSGDCVHMRSDNDWQWLEKSCNFVAGYFYYYICEYRRVASLNVTATSPGRPVITSVTEVTRSVATDYPLAVLSSSATSDTTHDAAGAMASKSDVTVPLSVSVAVAVVVVALIAIAVVVCRRQQRARSPKGAIVTWTRRDGDDAIVVGNPVYGDSAQPTIDPATLTHGSGNGGVSGRPVSNVYAEMSSAVPVMKSQKDGAVDYCLADRDTEPTYAEPLMTEPTAAVAAESATPYHHYVYIDTATLLKPQQSETSADEAAFMDKNPKPVYADPGQPCYHAQQLHGSRSTQDGYEPFVSQWTPYENVQKPDT